MATLRTGGQILVDQLLLHGVDHIFCVPGESYLPVLDALRDAPITVTVCRQEGGAAMMAEAYGKLTGRPGICFVTRGPGATNASPGIHVADQDSTPVIMFVGQVVQEFLGREAFQELNYRSVFGSMTRWVTEITSVSRIPEMVSYAYQRALSGRPGPVVVAVPEDIVNAKGKVEDARPYRVIETYAGIAQLNEMMSLVAQANLPVAILGGSRWSAVAVERFMQFAQRLDLATIVTFRRQMLFPADHPCYVGDLGVRPNPALLSFLDRADLILLIGDRMSEIPSQQYTLLRDHSRHRLVHVYPDPGELNRTHYPELAINASPEAFCEAIGTLHGIRTGNWASEVRDAHAAYLKWSDTTTTSTPGELQLGSIMGFLRSHLPADAILCNGAGNYAAWVHRFFRFRGYGTQLAPTSGSMGYGVPAAVAAKRLHRDRMVLAFAGDGCFLMHGQEFATAVQYGLPIIVIIIDNQMYGTIRMHQERQYPGRVHATALKNPDFAAYARAFGGHGERVTRTDEFGAAFDRALAADKPAILHCLIDPEAIAPMQTLASIRARSSSDQSK